MALPLLLFLLAPPTLQAGDALSHQQAVAALRSGGGGGSGTGGSGSGPSSASDPGQAAAQAMAQASARTNDALAQTAQALQVMRAAQIAARTQAISGPNNLGTNPNNPAIQLPNVPDGLAGGALVPDSGLSQPGVANPVVTWVGAKTPVQTANGGQTQVTIEQTQQQALLNWQTFNIGKNTLLDFDQSAGGANVSQWVAFNKINDPSLAPSQILGAIQALGQVYVINQNGIIFGPHSQVDVHTLVASSLPINDNLVSKGLLNSADLQFLFSTQPLAAGKLDSSGFTPVFIDPLFTVSGAANTHTLTQKLSSSNALTVNYYPSGPTPKNLVSGTDYTMSLDGSGNTVLAFTPAGLGKIAGASVGVSYVPASVHTGDVTVQQGAILNGTPIVNEPVILGNAAATQKLSDVVAAGTAPTVAYTPSGGVATPLSLGVDYTLSVDTDGKTIVMLTQNGLAKVAGAPASVAYTPVTNGGRIALVGANVNNAGTISTPDGQTILAAGLQVGMAAHSTNDPHLRGLDVYVGAADQFTGVATNTGVIDAPRGNVTVAGRQVNQMGGIDSSTSVALNGSVNLMADYSAAINPQYDPVSNPDVLPFIPQSIDGTVTLGAGSVTRILPEVESADTVVGTELALRSQVKMEGAVIHLAPDSQLLAPNAEVTLKAGVWLPNNGGSFIYSDGQVALDSGAVINVAGSEDVNASVTENIISLQLTGTELANSPLQRNGMLRGKKIQVDITQYGTDSNGNTWIGTQIADVSGYANLIQRSVGELTTAGGSVTINAGGSLAMQAGSNIDVSGGWTNYQGAYIQTTKLLAGGNIIDISKATPDRVYDGIYDGFTQSSAKWGTSQTYINPLLVGATYRNGYVQGGGGGSLAVTAPAMTLKGGLYGNTVAGQQQRMPDAKVKATFSSTSVLPAMRSILSVPGAGSLSLSFLKQNPDPSNPVFYSPTPPHIAFTFGPALNPADPMELDLSPHLIGVNGFGNLSIGNSDGNITVPFGVVLADSPLGSITMTGANIDIQGKISAPDGNLNYTVYDFTPNPEFQVLQQPPPTPSPDSSRGHFILGSAASLSTAGLIVDDRAGSSLSPLATAGGTVSIKSYSADLAVGSKIDASSGVALSGTSKEAFGDGGSITINAGQDPGTPALVGGILNLNASLRGYAGIGKKGAALNILAPLIQIGGATTDPDTLLLSSDFFSQGGFSSFTLTGLGKADGHGGYFPAVYIAPGTSITPVAQNSVIDPNAAGIALTSILAPQGLRTGVNLSFVAAGVQDSNQPLGLAVRGDFLMGEGAVIQTDPQSDPTRGVSISGYTAAVLGSIIAPGGTISVSGKSSNSFSINTSQALVSVYLGPDSVLSTAGTTLLVPDTSGHGYRTGSVLNGGAIKISGNIMAEAGATLDVSGASDTLYLPESYSNASGGVSALVPTLIDSNGGSITLAGIQELFTDAMLKGHAGGSAAQGGNLSISSGFIKTAGIAIPLDPNLWVAQSGLTIPKPFAPGSTGIGQLVTDTGGNALPFLGHFTADSFYSGGFDSLALGGTVQFSGPVTITAKRSINVASGGFLLGDSAINLSAPYVAIGTSFHAPYSPLSPPANIFSDALGRPFYTPPAYGAGDLTVSAGLIDIGNLSLQGIGKANFYADNGDIRGGGTLDVAGDITMRAGQVYTPTAVSFTIAAYDHGATPGSVTFEASGSRQLPISAGGILNIYASTINQGGVLRAPFGSINLGWNGLGSTPVDLITGSGVTDSNGNSVATLNIKSTQTLALSSGSVTSVSGVDPVTGQGLTSPYGTNLNGAQWIDPSGTDITTVGPPVKSVNISAQQVTDGSGSSIDISGGGDLYAYRWVSGVGGTRDILASSTAYAVIPGYQADYAPIDQTVDSNGAHPYQNTSLKVGDQIYLGAGSGLPSGVYTLLPARYALLPGAFLVTPKSSVVPNGTTVMPDSSSLVSGYRFNNLSPLPTGRQPLFASFEVAPQSVLRARAEYDLSLANGDVFINNGIASLPNSFFVQSAQTNNLAVPRLPLDSGQLVLAATQAMAIHGAVDSQAPAGGRGGLVDINSPSDILIAGPGASGVPGELVLDSSGLTNFGAGSLLIGGVRQIGANGTTITVTTHNITVDNAGAPLKGPDIILAANQSLALAQNADIEQIGTASGLDNILLIGNSTSGKGDGALLRVSSDVSTQLVRSSVDSSAVPLMTIGQGARISGASVTLDSTSRTSFDSSAVLSGQTINLGSGQTSLVLDNSQPVTSGLVLSNAALQNLQSSAQALSLLSYSTIDIYGTGQIGTPGFNSLVLHTAAIRGYNNGGGTVSFMAQNIQLDNSPGRTVAAPAPVLAGTLEFDASTLRLGVGQLGVDLYANLNLNASGGVLVEGNGGLAAQGNIHIITPEITGAAAAAQSITAGGSLLIDKSGVSTIDSLGGLGASLVLQGANVSVNTDVTLKSGLLKLHALNGGVVVGGILDAGGSAKVFFDQIKYSNGGQIILESDTGSVTLALSGSVSVAAQSAAGDAGTISISAPAGTFVHDGALSGQAGAGGQGGSFSLDVATMDPSTVLGGNDLASLELALASNGFDQSQSIRVRGGGSNGVNNDVYVAAGTTARVHTFNLSTDQGSITVGGKIDASGATGGAVNLTAQGSVVLESGAILTVKGDTFNDAGKGGAVTLEAGSETNGSFSNQALGAGPQIHIQSGSAIDLSVAQNATPAVTSANAAIGKFSGTLNLRAPQTAGNTDLQIKEIDGTILGASSILVEGYQVYAPAVGSINNTVESAVQNNGNTFGGNAAAITNRLFAGNAGLKPLAVIASGAEIINTNGNLTLSIDWDLHTFRFGPNSAPGVLTLRASGNLVFNGTLSDGFNGSTYNATLLAANPALPLNAQSWSYRLAAGADFSAADFHQVQSLASLAANSGSLKLGINGTGSPSVGNTGTKALTSDAVKGHYQVIRTGSGDIDISVGRDVQLLNPFATIYTAGAKVTDPTLGGTFVTPPSANISSSSEGNLGATQETPTYPAQYSMAGGNVTIAAQGDIKHQTLFQGQLIDDSEKQLPDNWLYRRGYMDPTTGQFGIAKFGDVASTTWWVDFSNFFEGVGALGGGNVTLVAGGDVRNVDAVIPTNARMPVGKPNAGNMVELGGGDLSVTAGNNISGGVYYVERGQGTLSVGNTITTNSTRSPSVPQYLSLNSTVLPSQTWLPTTLYLGKGGFDVTARGNVLLGPIVNAFMLPQGISNTFYDKTYFSTYAANDTVNVSSLGGNVTFRNDVTLPGNEQTTPVLIAWLENVNLLRSLPATVSFYEPWLRLVETDVDPYFDTFAALAPPTLQATAFSGDINLGGSITLSPSPGGTVDFAATGSINGLQSNGVTNFSATFTPITSWGSSQINLSDADPNSVPGVASPSAVQAVPGVGISTNVARQTNSQLLGSLGAMFQESGSTEGTHAVLQAKQVLHTPGLLHQNDPNPLRLYALGGDISGLTLFSGKFSRIYAGNDITDTSFYIQNNNAADISIVSAGRDIIPYDANSALLQAASQPGNVTNSALNNFNTSPYQAGDIQISGPGTLEVLAGRNLNLGIGAGNSDGTGVGITSIGNTRNPYLSFGGADIIAGAGIGAPAGDLASPSSKFDFSAFIAAILNPATAGAQATRYLPDLPALALPADTFSQQAPATGYLNNLGVLLGLSGKPTGQQVLAAFNLQPPSQQTSLAWNAFQQLPASQQDVLALGIFYLALRDAGRDHNNPSSPGFQSFASANAAIAALFPGNTWKGDILTQGRDIRTTSGGNISLFAPGGGLTLASTAIGNPLTPPGIVTEDGGSIAIFTRGSVNLGISRIFTLRGGNEIIWSSNGDIAAGASSRTVQSAPPTRVLIDPQSGDVQTDLAGLATGGGIGVLNTVPGVKPGDVDLVAPNGTINAGDAGIRVSGNLNLAAVQVLNAGNIQVGGQSAGVPVAAPGVSLGSLTSASNTTAGAASAAADVAKQAQNEAAGAQQGETPPSIITVEVIGYGGADGPL
ncbi:MAG: filamentous hemagglutinin family protein [Methylacidiphilales bacterium]|nr:filamentous hemagglutinin family protein [Candidatus Methylacidiphilales bacterium]